MFLELLSSRLFVGSALLQNCAFDFLDCSQGVLLGRVSVQSRAGLVLRNFTLVLLLTCVSWQLPGIQSALCDSRVRGLRYLLCRRRWRSDFEKVRILVWKLAPSWKLYSVSGARMGCSNAITGVLNFLTMMLSLPIIGFGVWLMKKHDSECVRFLQWPVIVLGVFVLVVSMAGMLGSWCGIRSLMWTYLFVMFTLIFLLFVFTIFAFVVTNSGAGRVVSGKGYKEYKLGDYSNWLQKGVDKPSYWSKIKSCLADGRVCSDLTKYPTVDAFNKAPLTPLESGCCKPPSDCGFTFQNATTWKGNPSGSTNTDCRVWSNSQTQLCFDCTSCRAGVLQNVKSNWRRVAVVNTIVLVFIIVVYSCGCCALKSSQRERADHKYRFGYA